jgi:hypothetical protein
LKYIIPETKKIRSLYVYLEVLGSGKSRHCKNAKTLFLLTALIYIFDVNLCSAE